MKKPMFILSFLLLSLVASAQWGIKGGLDYGKLAGHDKATWKPGFHIGATYDIKLGEKFFFQPAALFSLYRFGYKEIPSIMKDGIINKYVIEMPLNISFRSFVGESTQLAFDLGLYGKYGLFGDKKYTNWEGDVSQGSSYHGYNRFDMGLNVGGGVYFDKIYVGIAYQHGIVSGFDSSSSVRNTLLRLSLGYKF